MKTGHVLTQFTLPKQDMIFKPNKKIKCYLVEKNIELDWKMDIYFSG